MKLAVVQGLHWIYDYCPKRRNQKLQNAMKIAQSASSHIGPRLEYS
jgi:hypothetical protein